MSVCKTEESLRRLKSRTLNTSGEDSSHGSKDTMSDETKIREQIKYDVGYFSDKVCYIYIAFQVFKLKYFVVISFSNEACKR